MEHYRLETKLVETAAGCASFAERDLFYFLKEEANFPSRFLCVERFEIPAPHRSKGLGTKILKQFCEENKEKHVLFLIAGCLVEECDAEPSPSELREKLLRLERFYSSIGFANVNSHIGGYENKTSFLYDGGKGKEIVRLLKEKD